MNTPTLKQPTAFLPIVFSFAALVLVLGHAAMYGIVHEADEGTPAHIFQLLMVLQVPFIVFFAIKWVPKAPWPATKLLLLQIGAALAAILSVLFLT